MKHFSFLRSAAIAASVLCLNPQIATAQKSDSTLLNSLNLTPVEIKGIRVDRKSPYAISNLDSSKIHETENVRDIPYLLNQTPSVNITSDGGSGVGYTAIHIRGTDASRINFTMNGIPINDAESQNTYFVDFPDILSSTNSIQIQRGVGSSTNGAGAFGASVNFSDIQQNTNPYAVVNSAYGSFNTLKNSVKAGTGMLKNGFNFDVRFSKVNSDGYIDRATSDLQSMQFLAGWISKNNKSSIKFNLLMGKEKTGQAWDGVPEDSIKAGNRTYNELGLMPNGQFYDNQTDNYKQNYFQLFLNHKFDKNWDGHAALFLTRGIGYYEEYHIQEPFANYYLPPFTTAKGDTFSTTNLVRQLWLDNYFYGATYSLNYQKKKTKFNLGGIMSRYNGRHYGYVTWADYGFPNNYQWYDLPMFKNDFSAYAKLQQEIGDKFYIFADLQYRHIDYKMDGFRQDPDLKPYVHYDFLNPKAGFSYIIENKHNSISKIYGSFALANKEPNRDDFEASKNELPTPETLYDVELGYKFLAKKWRMGANLYYMDYRNQLVLTGKINDVGAYTRQNVPSSYRAGIEWTASYQPFPALALVANATYSQNKIKDFHEFIDDYDNGGQIENVYSSTDIALSPNVIAYACATIQPFAKKWKNKRFYIDLIGKHVGKQYLDNTTNNNRSINPYTLANFRLRYELKTKRFIRNIGFSLSLNNVFNEMYSSNGATYPYFYGGKIINDNYYFPQAGFNFIFGVKLNF